MQDFIKQQGSRVEVPNLQESLIQPPKRRRYFFVAGLVIVILISYFLFFAPPLGFPVGTIINIGEGAGLRSVSLELKQANVIKSRTAFEAAVIFFGGEKHIIPADYLFDQRENVLQIARRISTGDRHLAPVSVTIPEGYNLLEIADLFTTKLSTFSKENFLKLAEGKEGFLFPDTYFFFTTDNETHALKAMEINYEKKIAPIRASILATGKTEREIITMASVIEREAEGNGDRSVISGILWRRLSIGMALQADAAPETYKSRGLPKNPICNPGLDSIKAAITPEKSNYLYYLHDKQGTIHYAKNFEEHKANIQLYLK